MRACTHTLTLTDCPAGGQRGVHMVGGERGEEEEVGDRDSDPQQLAWPIAWEGGRQGAPWAIPREAWGRQGLAFCVHHSGPRELG